MITVIGCNSSNAEITDIAILKTGVDTEKAFCKDFSLTREQVREFFNKSRVIDINEFHDNYEYLPCYVKGSLTRSGVKCTFTIRAGGTVELLCGKDEGLLLVCDKCDHLLGGRE